MKIEINEEIFKALVNSKIISNFMSQFLMNKQQFNIIILKKNTLFINNK